MAIKSVSIRIEEKMLQKIRYVAEYEGRSINSHILALIRADIMRYENEVGDIEDEIPPDVNIKPGRR